MTNQEDKLLERYLLIMLAHVVAVLADDAGKNVDAQDLRDMAIHVAGIDASQRSGVIRQQRQTPGEEI